MRQALLALPFLALISSAPAEQEQPAATPEGYTLAWSDEFNTGTQPNPNDWSYETGHIRNHELQYYTSRPENCRVEDGHLVIECRKESYTPPNAKKPETITSASIETRGHHQWTYGRFEARVKLPSAKGTWPAVWMLGEPKDPAWNRWPDRGEIDIVEHVGYLPNLIHGTVHTKAYNHVKKTQKGATTKVADVTSDFHLYTVDWTPEQITFLFDNQPYYTVRNEHKTEAEWPFDHPEYLKINFAFGGDWGAHDGTDDSKLPLKLEVDYVRVYQKK